MDIDECATGNGGCDALTTCTNTPGGFTCGACPSGYTGGGASGCIDIDECATGNGGCDALTTCTNTAGSFTCGACPSGYSGSGASGCIDIDECATGYGCDALTTCTNTPGGFTCSACPSGYSGTGETGCTDIDECATGTDDCHADAACTNTAGSFSCACNAGLNGDGVSCSACESLAVGGTIMARPNTRSSVCIENPSGSTAEYVLIPMNLTQGASYPLTVVANNLATLTGTTSTPAAVVDTHTASRTAHTAEVVSRLGTTGSGTPVSPTSRIPTGVPVVGATWSLNGELGTQCASGTARTGTVRYVGTHAIIVTDNANPPGGLTTPQYETLGSKFDNVIYPSVSGVFGAPTDVDGNGRVVLFFTAAVNAHVTDNAASAWAQYRPRDLSSQVECPTSNHGEIIYVMAADPTATSGPVVRTVSAVETTTLNPIAHELGHLIIDSRRMSAGWPFEESWLDEGLAGIAEERAFYGASVGLAPGMNILLTDLTTGPNASTRVNAFNSYETPLFTRLREWMKVPARVGFVDGTTADVGQRGLAWSFVRYSADRIAAGSSAAEATFLYQLANASTTGLTNLNERIGGGASLWMRDFLAAVYIDDTAIANLDIATLPYRTSSWSFRSVYGGLGGFPLQTPALTRDVPVSLNLARGGGASYLRFALAASIETTITLTPPTGTSWDAWYMILRRQ